MSSLARKKDVWSSKLQSFVVIEDKGADHEIITKDNAIAILRGDGKKQTFTFDSVMEEGMSEQLLPQLRKTVQLIRLGFNTSIYFNGISKNQESSAENTVIRDQIQTLYAGFENDERNVENGIQSGGEILLFRTVKLSCYELFDGHIVDLSAHQSDEAKAKVTNSRTSLRLLHGTVTNQTKELCPTFESAMTFITHAMQARQFLCVSTPVAPYDVKTADVTRPPPIPPRLLGAISSMFIALSVEQLVYTIDSVESTTRESILEFALFPSA